MDRHQVETISFKADSELARALEGIHNRSEFIRSAILKALGNICPLCNGEGILSASQQLHWENFSLNHHIQTCSDCNQGYLVCDEKVVS